MRIACEHVAAFEVAHAIVQNKAMAACEGGAGYAAHAHAGARRHRIHMECGRIRVELGAKDLEVRLGDVNVAVCRGWWR